LDHQMIPHMRQTQVLSQQARITIHILQLPLLELGEFLEQEIWENPLLEDAKDGAEGAADKIEAFDEGTDTGDSQLQRPGRYDDEDEEKRRYAETLITKAETLEDHLLWQLGMFLEGMEYEIGEYIIGNLDDNGYLKVTVKESAENFNVGSSEVEKVLSLIQTFDPIGAGARDVRECLLIQLRSQGREESLCYKIADTSLCDLEKKDYPKIAKRLGVELAKVKKACVQINSLEPKPGRGYSPDKAVWAIPELILKKENDSYVVEMNNRYLPFLRISKCYSDLLKDKETDDRTRGFLEKKQKRAGWVINAILQRQYTIKQVAEYMVNFQKAFIENTRGEMRPLKLTDVADEVGLNESTISRAIAHKYVQTECGAVPLKRFLSTGLKQESGKAVSSDLIKHKIKEMIDNENRQKPLSDQKITDILKKDEINVARRTVAKYRESMKISPAYLRKR